MLITVRAYRVDTLQLTMHYLLVRVKMPVCFTENLDCKQSLSG